MKVIVDPDLCIGCNVCEDACPEVFEVREDGIAYVIAEDPAHELYGPIRDSVEMCPVAAISISE